METKGSLMESRFIKLELFTGARKEKILILWDRKQNPSLKNGASSLNKKDLKPTVTKFLCMLFFLYSYSGNSVK